MRQEQFRTPPSAPAGEWQEVGHREVTRENEIDAAFLEEIRPAAEAPRPQPTAAEPPPARHEPSIEEEMSRLLDDLVEDEKSRR